MILPSFLSAGLCFSKGAKVFTSAFGHLSEAWAVGKVTDFEVFRIACKGWDIIPVAEHLPDTHKALD